MVRLLLFILLILPLPSFAQETSTDSFFSEKDYEEMAIIGQYLHEKIRLEHQCAEKEDSGPCVERACLIPNFTSDVQSADFWESLGLLGAFTEEELKCIFKGTEAASYLLVFRNFSAEMEEAENPLEKFSELMLQLYNHPFRKEIDEFLVGEKTEDSEDEIQDILDDLEIILKN